MTRRRNSTLWLFLFALLFTGAVEDLVFGQNVAFDPGFVSLTAGDPTGKNGYSQPSYSGPASGLVFHNSTMSVAADSYGNVYVGNSLLIWVIASGNGPIPVLPSAGPNPTKGNAYLVAGTGQGVGSKPPCASGTDVQGDGCPATQASVSVPGASGNLPIQGGLAVDSHNNLFILNGAYSPFSATSNMLRVVYSGAGSIPNLPAGAQAGYIYAIANTGDAPSGNPGDGSSALNATFSSPSGISIDRDGNIYIADAGNDAVRVIYDSGNVPNLPNGAVAGDIYTVGGTLGTSCPYDETSTGFFYSSPCGDNGPATAAQLGGNTFSGGTAGISGIYVDANGNIYISDTGNFRVRVIYAAGKVPNVTNPTVGYIYTIAGNGYQSGYSDWVNYGAPQPPPGIDGPALDTTFANLSGIVGDAGGNIYITDADYGIQQNVQKYNAIRKIDPVGNIETIVPFGAAICPNHTDVLGDGCPANAAQIGEPLNVGIDPSGNLYVTDQGGNTVTNQSYAVLHQLSVSQTALTTASTVSRPQLQIVTLANTGAQTLQLSAISYQGNNGDTSFSQAPTGGNNDCSSTTALAPGASCQLEIAFTPESVGTFSGAMAVASNALNATQGVNLIQVSGTATQSATTTELAIAPEDANVGQQVTLTATIVPDYGSEKTPTGTVTFTTADGATTLGAATVTNGVATLQTNSLGAGTYSLKASYSGDANYQSSISYPASLTVSSKQVPNIALTASSSAINTGQTLTLTANVTPYSGTTTPTGTVTFQDGVVALGQATLNASGTATFTTSVLDIGSNSIVAVYSGDSHYAPAGSTPVSVVVTTTAQLQLTPSNITRVAGQYYFTGYNPIYSGDNGPATAAYFALPQGVAIDANDNLYILDTGNNVVRAVYSGQGGLPGIGGNLTNGNVYLVAGTPQKACTSPTASCGDNGPATSAFLGYPTPLTSGPTALAVDAAGNLYIGDGGTNRLRKVDAKTGVITTIAGTGVSGYTGDGGPGASAEIGSVVSVAVDNAGNVYFTDNQSYAIRKIDAISGVITTIAGTGTNGYTPDNNLAVTAAMNPTMIALDGVGNLYVADNFVVRKIDAKTGLLTTIAGRELAGNGYGGDNGPATEAQLGNVGGLIVDSAGNLYILDSTNYALRTVNAVSGIITTIAGTPTVYCAAAPCGDGGLATNAQLASGPQGIAVDSQGNVYIADTGSSGIREVSATATALDFGSQNQGTAATQTLTVTNTGGTLLILSGLAFSDPSFTQQSSGGIDCSSTTTLKADEQCQIAVSFFPVQTGAISSTLTINSSASNVSNGQTVIPLKGTGVSLGGTQPQTINFPALPAGINYGQTVPLNATASSGLPIVYLVSGPGRLKGATLTAIGAGTITVTAYQFGEDQFGHATQYAAAAPVSQTTTAVGGVTLTVAATDESYIQGTPVPALAYSITGLVNGDTTNGTPSLTTSATQSSPKGTYPIVITQGTLQAPGVYQMKFVNGTMHVTGSSAQTINFAPIGNLTYGSAPVPLSATASSGDPVAFAVTSGPALISGTAAAPTLTITGAGPVTVTAMAYGDTTYKAANPVPQTITVAQHPLTVTASNVTVTQGQPIPPLNTPGFTVNTAQLVNGDTTAVLSGSPVLTTTATQNSPVGTYPISITQGTLAAANYALTFVNGTLTIKQGQPQTVTFPPIANETYGTQPISLGASASSNLPVTYSISVGANIASISDKTIIIQGAGQITVVATQSGNSTYSPASATQTFTVAPAVATITAANVSRPNNTQNPKLTGFTISGLVNGDTSDAISGTPAETTTALPGSPVGTYPINIAVGTLAAAKYTFNLVPGTLTITPGGPTADFSLTANPATLTMLSGQTRQSVIILTPTNYYQGLVKLSCGQLPANVTCTFSPGTLAPDGSGNPVQTALTVNTSSSTPVVGALRQAQDARISLAAAFYLPGVLTGLLLAIQRKRFAKHATRQHLLVVLLLLAGAIGLTACGGGSTASSGNNGNAAPGTSTITVTATGADNTSPSNNTSHPITLSITVE